ncbi:MAG: (2Fe-2S)-binding protein [Candidatus Eisenbacteria bacterium]|nr:(2Fe-2S)-binding protein [Candidatus Eisenbacteria bacterium]
MKIRVHVNGAWREANAPPMKRLLDCLREDLGLTGSKEGCGEGECGACTVLLDGQAVNSCLVPACQADGAHVITVEGLARGGRLSRLQEAFLQGGAQCGICTPGMLMSSVALLRSPGVPSEAKVREALAGNLCRCTGYVKIVEAVRDAARKPGVKRPSAKKLAPGKVARKKPAAKKAAARKAAARKAAARKAAAKKAAAKKAAAKKNATRKAARGRAVTGAAKRSRRA